MLDQYVQGLKPMVQCGVLKGNTIKTLYLYNIAKIIGQLDAQINAYLCIYTLAMQQKNYGMQYNDPKGYEPMELDSEFAKQTINNYNIAN